MTVYALSTVFVLITPTPGLLRKLLLLLPPLALKVVRGARVVGEGGRDVDIDEVDGDRHLVK